MGDLLDDTFITLGKGQAKIEQPKCIFYTTKVTAMAKVGKTWVNAILLHLSFNAVYGVLEHEPPRCNVSGRLLVSSNPLIEQTDTLLKTRAR